MTDPRTTYDVVEVLSVKRHQWVIPSGASLGALEATILDVHDIGGQHHGPGTAGTSATAQVDVRDGHIVISFEVRSGVSAS